VAFDPCSRFHLVGEGLVVVVDEYWNDESFYASHTS